MISHRKKFIFIHIPKTGGTSISKRLKRWGIFKQGALNFRSIYHKHATCKYLLTTLGPDEFRKYYKFTIVRNPFDWIVSNYEFNRGLHLPFISGTNYKVWANIPEWAENMSFEYWLKWWVHTFNPSQSLMVEDDNGKLLVDKIYKFENLFNSYLHICMSLKVFPRNLPHKYKTRYENPWREYFNDELIEFTIQNFRKDFLNFNYDLTIIKPY